MNGWMDVCVDRWCAGVWMDVPSRTLSVVHLVSALGKTRPKLPSSGNS